MKIKIFVIIVAILILLFGTVSVASNVIAVNLNNGKMPVDRAIIIQHNLRVIDSTHSMSNENTRVRFLTDIFYNPFSKNGQLVVISIGDIFAYLTILTIILGILIFIIYLLKISFNINKKAIKSGDEKGLLQISRHDAKI